jgi:hypothetical protein
LGAIGAEVRQTKAKANDWIAAVCMLNPRGESCTEGYGRMAAVTYGRISARGLKFGDNFVNIGYGRRGTGWPKLAGWSQQVAA